MENPGVEVITPAKRFDFASPKDAGPIALSSDGSRVIYTDETKVLDIGGALFSIWPESVLSVLGVVLPWRLVAALRRRRRYPIEHGPFCARCAYPTQGLTSDACPECGKTLAGRGTRRGVGRARTLTMAGLSLLLGYAALTVYALTEPPRTITADRLPDWYYEDLAKWAQKKQYDWLIKHVHTATVLRSFEVTDPSALKTVGYVLWDQPIALISFHHNVLYRWDRQLSRTNPGNTHAILSTDDYYALFDFEAMRIAEHGQLKAEILSSRRLSRDATFCFDASISPPVRWYGEAFDGTGDYELLAEPQPLITIPIRHRSNRTMLESFQDNPSFQPEPYEDSAIKIKPITAGDEVLYFSGPAFVWGYVQAGFIVVHNARSIMLFDLDSEQWVAELETSRLMSIHAGGFPVDVFISADRGTAVISREKISQSKKAVAVYRLPAPPSQP